MAVTDTCPRSIRAGAAGTHTQFPTIFYWVCAWRVLRAGLFEAREARLREERDTARQAADAALLAREAADMRASDLSSRVDLLAQAGARSEQQPCTGYLQPCRCRQDVHADANLSSSPWRLRRRAIQREPPRHAHRPRTLRWLEA